MDKIQLFEITFNKLSDDRSYMAYYLKQLMLNENKTRDEIIELLSCSEENFYKLALCKAPEMASPDFKRRISKIAEYSRTSDNVLANIIDHATIKTSVVAKKQPSILEESWAIFRNWIPLPGWVYQPLITTLVIVLFVIPVFSHGRGTNNIQMYVGEFIHYTDSVKYLQLPDKTTVYKGNL